MAYLKASPTYHLNGLSALGMSHGLDSLQSQSIHYGGGKYLVWCSVIQYGILIAIVLDIELISEILNFPFFARRASCCIRTILTQMFHLGRRRAYC